MEKQTIYITLGVPASGKTTWAKEKIKKNEHIVRLSRDGFREMLNFYDSIDPGLEKNITTLQTNCLKELLTKKYSIIIDATHTRASYVKDILEICKPFKVDVELMDFSNVPLQTCLDRNKNRDRVVPEDVIKKMYNSLQQSKQDSWKVWGEYQEEIKKETVGKIYNPAKDLPLAVMCDIDGTLAVMCNRSPYDESRVLEDTLYEHVREQLILHKNSGKIIIICSGRTDSCKEDTEKWLNKYEVPWDFLYMRKTGDQRKDSIIKKEIFDNYIKDKFAIKAVYDDRMSVVRLWFSLGLPLFRVGDPDAIF